MRLIIGFGTEIIGVPPSPKEMIDEVVAAEAAGAEAAWGVNFARLVDGLSMLAAAAVATDRIELGVGVVPTYPRSPVLMAQQAATVQALAGGRITLGVGVSHRPVIEGLYGLAYERPASHMREYLTILGGLLAHGRVRFKGEFYDVDAEFTIPGTSRVPVVVGALAPQMVRVAGECADGVITWLAGQRSLGEGIVPGVRAAAASAGRPAPRVIAMLPVAVADDSDDARAAADKVFVRARGLVNYQRQFEREGVGAPRDIAIVGDESAVERQIASYVDLGITEFWPVPYPVGPDGPASLTRTRALIERLAKERRSPLPTADDLPPNQGGQALRLEGSFRYDPSWRCPRSDTAMTTRFITSRGGSLYHLGRGAYSNLTDPGTS